MCSRSISSYKSDALEDCPESEATVLEMRRHFAMRCCRRAPSCYTVGDHPGSRTDLSVQCSGTDSRHTTPPPLVPGSRVLSCMSTTNVLICARGVCLLILAYLMLKMRPLLILFFNSSTIFLVSFGMCLTDLPAKNGSASVISARYTIWWACTACTPIYRLPLVTLNLAIEGAPPNQHSRRAVYIRQSRDPSRRF